ncbi:hypothetical protein EDB86DRAFT_3082942 [Lactarius hatsudake]|nr:hypothetical protein EDB86DRAFT_3082942 [Lactarius hatsudake]
MLFVPSLPPGVMMKRALPPPLSQGMTYSEDHQPYVASIRVLRMLTPGDSTLQTSPGPRFQLKVITGDNDPDKSQRRGGISPRWRAYKHFLYYFVFIVGFTWMVYIPIEAALVSGTLPNYDLCRHRLAEGWLPRSEIVTFTSRVVIVDPPPPRFRIISTMLPLQMLTRYHRATATRSTAPFAQTSQPPAAVMATFFALKYAYIRLILRDSSPTNNLHRIPFYLIFSLLMLIVRRANYGLAKATGGTQLAVPVTWLFNDEVLFANEWYGGYAFASLHSGFTFLHVRFNITMLRLMSFSIDYHWACNHIGIADPGGALTDKKRAAIFHPRATYTFANYLAYALYAPLYIAGPILTFNDFMWQVCTSISVPYPPLQAFAIWLSRPREITPRATAVRFVIGLLTMETLIRLMYVVAIKDAHAWSGMTPAQLSMVGFWNLIFVWLKLLLPWRFFRLWVLVDGLDPPENMVRCMANNYLRSVFGARGTARTTSGSIVVFTFVALWHDLSTRLLARGWLAAIHPIGSRGEEGVPAVPDKCWYRHACAAGGVGNVLLIMGANLVGFVLGVDGARYFAHELISSWAGIRFLFGASACLFAGVQLMLEYREEELRRGIQRRC